MIRDIKIHTVLNGFIVDVGCQTVVFDRKDSLLLALEAYLKDPNGVQKAWLDTSLNSKHTYNNGPLIGSAIQRDGRVDDVVRVGDQAIVRERLPEEIPASTMPR